MEDELRFHLEHEVAKHERSGLPKAAAERRARVEFGGFDQIKEEARDARGVGWIDALLQDLKYGWRGLISKPGFTVAVVLTLGLGIGANTAMFGIVDRLLFRPPDFLEAPERVHRLYVSYVLNGQPRTDRHIDYKLYLELTQSAASFEQSAAFAYRQLAIGTGEQSRELTVATVSATFFDFFDARPQLGRFYAAAEDRFPAGERVAVLGYGFWQSAMGGSRTVLGQSLQVGDVAYTIIGVAPKGMVGVTEGPAPAVFLPITAFAYSRRKDYAENHGWSWLEVVARRKPGVTVAAANAELNAAFVRSWEAERQAQPGLPSATAARARVEAAPVHLARGPQAGADAKVVAWVMGVAIIVLLIASANVINLLLARGVHRRREIALRLALGVTRARLLQQLLTETLLMALLGGLVGLAAAQWGGRAVRTLFLRPEDAAAVATDARTLFFTTAIALMLALLTGLVPGLQALRADVAGTLKAGARDSGYHASRLRTGLLLFQAALSFVLLVGAGLFVRSLANVRSFRLGYDVEPTMYVGGNLRGVELSPAQRHALAARLMDAALSVPGVRSASWTISVPFWSNEGRGAPYVPGVDSVSKLGRFILQAGSTSYFETVGTRILRGRGFTDRDGAATAPIVVVNEAMAKALWPGQDPVGKRMRIGPDTMPFLTVVGVAEDMRGQRFTGDPEFWYYLPIDQYTARYGNLDLSLVVRINGAAEDFVERIRSRLQREMPGAAYVNAMPLSALVEPQQRSWHFGATMFVAFAALALVLAAIGLYSVIAYA
ncbi:MAG TPA: ABC transporter permease, partial [Longimicrobiales bacterium]|nr:ABC transporter permease [Longimicrobiales bacterium]